MKYSDDLASFAVLESPTVGAKEVFNSLYSSGTSQVAEGQDWEILGKQSILAYLKLQMSQKIIAIKLVHM
jgi:hypothetical protein